VIGWWILVGFFKFEVDNNGWLGAASDWVSSVVFVFCIFYIIDEGVATVAMVVVVMDKLEVGEKGLKEGVTIDGRGDWWESGLMLNFEVVVDSEAWMVLMKINQTVEIQPPDWFSIVHHLWWMVEIQYVLFF